MSRLAIAFFVVCASAPALAQPTPTTVPNDVDAQSSASPVASEEELVALAGDPDEPLDEETLKIYGFSDFTFRKYFFPAESSFGLVAQEESTFLVGSFNLYLRANLAERWTSLSEVRYTFLPNGAQHFDQGPDQDAVNTEFRDPIDQADIIRVGGIVIERVWLEYEWNAKLRVRMGRWFTPYGLWNIDHGSPTLLGATKPMIIGYNLMPSAQTGVLIQGEVRSLDFRVAYFASLANGKGATDEYRDVDNNKGIGAGFKLKSPWLDEATLGGAIYYGKHTSSREEGGLGGPNMDTFTLTTIIDEQSFELSLSADLKIRARNFVFMAEFVSEQTAYTEQGRPEHFAEPGRLQADTVDYGAYGTLGYELPWHNAIVWGSYEFSRADSFGVTVHKTVGGLVLRPVARITVKAAFTSLGFAKLPGRTSRVAYGTMYGSELQIAWVF